MISHIFKMMAKRKRKNFFLLLQLFISFLAMFLFVGLNLKKFTNYFRPLSYNYEKAWVLHVEYEDAVPEEKKAMYKQLIIEKLKALNEIADVSATTVIPFYQWGNEEKVEVNKQVSKALRFSVDERYKDLLDLKLVAGRWFNPSDFSLYTKPVVITTDMAEREFKDQNALGKKMLIEGKPAVVIGVSESFRENSSANSTPGFFIPAEGLSNLFLIKSPHVDNIALMDDKIRKSVMAISATDIQIKQSTSLSLLKKYAHKLDYMQLTIAFVIFGFLVINVFLGVSGMFSYTISRRKAEVGLRLAMGAKPSDILKQFLGETMVLTSLAILPGLLIAIQLLLIKYFEPYMDVYYGTLSIVFSALFLYLLMLSCAVYPSIKATRIQPANALHED
jgi:putative ABC transport system permease protein